VLENDLVSERKDEKGAIGEDQQVKQALYWWVVMEPLPLHDHRMFDLLVL
jgi:hypothetical protein